MKEKLYQFWQKRTQGEKVLLCLAFLLVFFLVLVPRVIEPLQEAFSEQSTRMSELHEAYAASPDILARYTKLVARRKDVDNFYRGANISTDPLTYLEGLLRETAKASGTYNVTPKEGLQLGGKYAHKFFKVNFQTSSYDNLTAFLKALTSGPQPMLLSQINLSKRPNSDALTVDLEVSGFEALNK